MCSVTRVAGRAGAQGREDAGAVEVQKRRLHNLVDEQMQRENCGHLLLGLGLARGGRDRRDDSAGQGWAKASGVEWMVQCRRVQRLAVREPRPSLL